MSFFKTEQISIRLFTGLVFLSSVVSVILILLLVSSYTRDAAVELQKSSLSRITAVAADGVLVDLRKKIINVGHSLQNRSEIRQALQEFYKSGNLSSLITQLDDPLINGFVGVSDIELVKLRVYNNDYHFIAESSRGIKGLMKSLPEFMLAEAAIRKGADKLKALGGIWTDDKSEATLYNILIPIGGLKIFGYLEVVVNPLFNLVDISKITHKALTIYNRKGKELRHIPLIENTNVLSLEKIKYTLLGKDHKSAYLIVLYDDISEFNNNMGEVRLMAVGSLVLLFIIVELISFFLMNRTLYKPIEHMIKQIRHVSKGELSINVDNRGLKDFHELALNFNIMKDKLHDSMKELEQKSLMDGLTGIGNRRFFNQELEIEWRNYKRNKNNLSLIICDIDFFKTFNDTYGHLAGDACIQMVAQAINNACHRPADLSFRYGGEEFAIILPDTPPNGALHVAELIQQFIAKLEIVHNKSSVSNYVTVSIGVVTVPYEDINSIEEFIHTADRALYQAKESGRNRVEIA